MTALLAPLTTKTPRMWLTESRCRGSLMGTLVLFGQFPDRRERQVVDPPVEVEGLLECIFDLLHNVGLLGGHYVGFTEVNLTLLSKAQIDVLHPIEVLEHRGKLATQRVRVVPVYGRGRLVHKVYYGATQIRDTVFGDVQRDDGRSCGVCPPQSEPDPHHPHHGGACGEPVGLVHLGIRVEYLVVQFFGQGYLHAPQKHRGQGAVGEGGQHQPPQPDRLSEDLDGVYCGVLRGEELYDRFNKQVGTHNEERQGGAQVPYGDDPVEAVREAACWTARVVVGSDEEGDRRYQAKEVLYPGGLHRLGRAQHQGEQDHGRGHVDEGEPL